MYQEMKFYSRDKDWFNINKLASVIQHMNRTKKSHHECNCYRNDFLQM